MPPSDLDFRIWQHEADNVTANWMSVFEGKAELIPLSIKCRFLTKLDPLAQGSPPCIILVMTTGRMGRVDESE